MTRSNTNYRTALVAPTANDSVRESHSYEYDNNGNILYVNTLRLKPDMTAQPDTVQRTREERFRWDEENRLTALSQNGYLSNYWYDADGERVIKEHGSNMVVFVNGRQDGCVTQTGRYSVYPNPYYSYGDDGRYTKHIYIGGERVLSQVGGVYGEPRILDVAGHDVRIKVDYPQIRASQDSVMEAAYSHFDLPYNGTDHDDFGRYPFDLPGYWNGSLQTPRDSEEDGDEGTPARTQEYLYYYHTDHLGSSTLITDGNGQLVQQIEYLPYGEVFLEKQASGSTYATPYKFNGKELDEETGLYYYGARYMNPRLSIWYGCDPLQERYPNVSSYTYCNDNSVCFIDDDGDSPTIVSGAIGAGVGAIIGGGIEMGAQLFRNGKVTSWKAVGGAAVQGAITGGVAGLTGGAILVVSVGASGTANAVGGTLNRAIQGEKTTVKDVVTDATIGATFGAVGKAAGNMTKNALDKSSNSFKGKVGEVKSRVKYAAKGYKREGNAVVKTGGKTSKGKEQAAYYDHSLVNVFTKKRIIVESKYNTSGLTTNQRAALKNVTVPFTVDRTTSTQIGHGVYKVCSGSSGVLGNRNR